MPARSVSAGGAGLWFGLGILAALPLNFAVGAISSSHLKTRQEPAAGDKVRAAAPPPAFHALIQRGFDLITAERHGEAFDEFQKAMKIAPTDPEPYLGLGDVYNKFQLYSLAEPAYRKAIQLDSTCWPAKKALSRILCDLGRNEEAIAFLKSNQRDTPNASFLWGEIAVNYLRLGKPEEAIPYLEMYARAESDQAWGFAHLGRAHSDLGQVPKAEENFREAIKRDPRMGLARLWLGQLLISTGRKEEGEEHLKAYRQLQDLATLAHRLATQINREPDNVKVLVQCAHVRALLGQYAKALVPLERAIELSPGDERLAKMRHGILDQISASQKGKKIP
jgi:tetratricopeptide (TPR) repeat protein